MLIHEPSHTPPLNLITIAYYKTEERLKELRNYHWDNKALDDYAERNPFSQFCIDCIKKEMPAPDERVIGGCDIIFKDSMKVDLGGITCIIDNIGGSHTDDSTVMHVPEENVLF